MQCLTSRLINFRFGAYLLCFLWVASMADADPDDLTEGTAEAFGASGIVSGSLVPGLPGASVRFAVLGDYGANGPNLEGIANMIQRWSPDFIITTGDNTYGNLDPDLDTDPDLPGCQNAWEFNIGTYFGDLMMSRDDRKFPLQRSPTQRFFPTVGNHDSAPDASNGGTIEGFNDYFHSNPGGEPRLPVDRGAVHNDEACYYVLRRGPLEIFVLDGDVPLRPDLIAAQKAWLSSRVAASNATWKIGVFHQPPLTSGFRSAASWMAWDELKSLNAILCGHDHFYERLDYFGTPLFITGAGGQFLYSFRSPPHPNSLTRYNLHHSAMLITADSVSMRFESRALVEPGQKETLVESFTLGAPSGVDNEDRYTFFAEAGETFTLRTTTPPPLSQPPLDPALEILTPGGDPVALAQITAPDGRNTGVTHLATHTGHWQVKVAAPPTGRGTYTLQLTLTSLAPAYSAWSAHLPAGQRQPSDDPDEDGEQNLLEYALQTNPQKPDPGANQAWQGLQLKLTPAQQSITVTFDLPSPLPPGISYQLISATRLIGPWQAIAWRPASADWQGLPGSSVLTSSPHPGARRTALTLPNQSNRRFFRLQATANQ